MVRAVGLYEHLIKVSPPIPISSHPIHLVAPDTGRKHQSEAVYQCRTVS